VTVWLNGTVFVSISVVVLSLISKCNEWLSLGTCNPFHTQPGHPLWVTALSTSNCWGVNRHTTLCSSLMSMIMQCELASATCIVLTENGASERL